jgi:flagellar operon protein
MAEVNGVQVPFVPIVQENIFPGREAGKTSDKFESIFQRELEKIKFSSHAAKRLEARHIELSDFDLEKLTDAIEKAEAKGSKDSLVMMDQTAFIVNIPNRTVITALPVGEGNENIFTNIDSVVVTT